MKLSIDGLLSIISFEGVMLDAYQDSPGIWTIGIGHTAMAGEPAPHSGMRISLDDAVRLFQRDMIKYEKQVNECITEPLSQNEFDAIVSWHFNTGGVVDSTLTTLLNDKKKSKAAAEFARWNKATINGKKTVLRGLTRRRKRETDVFTKSDYGDERITVDDGTAGGKREWTKKQFAALLTSTPVVMAENAPKLDPEEELSTAELLANPSSAILPTYRPRQRDAVTRATIRKFEHLLPADRRNDAVILLAVRGYYTDTMGKKGVNDRGIYDDAIFVVTPDEVINFNANTDPSTARRRMATLKSPQAVRYKPGLHGLNRKRGPYPAFRQDSSCTVVRDQMGEDTDSSASRFWINLHRGNNTSTSSRGCQTVPPNQWVEFKHLIDQLLKKYRQDNFYYLLVNEEEKAMEVATPEPQAPPPDTKAGELAEIRVAMAAITARLDALGAGSATDNRIPDDLGSPPLVPPNFPQWSETDLIAKRLSAALKEIEKLGGLKGRNSHEILRTVLSAIGVAPPLTPVNNALGPLIGNLLNGKKTVLGTVGLLATTLLAAFGDGSTATAAAEATTSGAAQNVMTGVGNAVSAIIPFATPILSALTGWGVLGKIDKYFATRT